MRNIWLWLAIAAAVIATGSAQAQEKGRPLYAVFHPAWPDCSPWSPRATVREVAADPERFSGKCVRVRGLASWRVLYGDLDAYQRRSRYAGQEDPVVVADSIGIYAPDGSWPRTNSGLAQAEILGKVGTCRQLWADAAFVSGYCHTNGGAFIAVDELDYRPVPVTRLTSDADRLEFGDIGLAPTSWRRRSEVVALTRDWVRAVAERDAEKLSALLRINRDAKGRRDEEALAPFLNSSRSPFADLRGWRQDHQIEVFLRKRHGDAGPNLTEEGWDWEGVACVCRGPDCSLAWPISFADASNARSRPFVCVTFSQMDDGTWWLKAPVDTREVREPAPR